MEDQQNQQAALDREGSGPPAGSGSGPRALAVGGDVGGAAAVAVGGLGPFDVEVQELHLQTEPEPALTGPRRARFCQHKHQIFTVRKEPDRGPVIRTQRFQHLDPQN